MPEIVQCEKLCDFLVQVLIKSWENLKILNKDFYSFRSVLAGEKGHNFISMKTCIRSDIIALWLEERCIEALHCSPVQGFKILLLPNLEEYLHGITIVVHFREPWEIALHFIPLSCLSLIFKILHVEKEARFLFKPEGRTTDPPQINSSEKSSKTK